MSAHPSLVGQRFGKLTVVCQAGSDKHGKRQWLCRCDCGKSHTAATGNLRSGHTTDCGCGKSPDLTGRVFGRLTVLGRAAQRAPRGCRTVPLWECRCQCGAITHKATDTLKNDAETMCAACAASYCAGTARAAAGYVDGTQLSRIRDMRPTARSTTGCRGVYYDKKTNKFRARLTFRGKTMNFGSFSNMEDAVRARKAAEEEYFGPLLETAANKEPSR